MSSLQLPPIKSAAGLVAWMREAAPYIHAFRGKTFVVAAGGEAFVEHAFAGLAQDLNLLASLGVRLVFAHGARPQIEGALAAHNVASRYVRGIRVSDEAALGIVKQETGKLRLEIEAALSSAAFSKRIAGGNFVIARPLGVIDGVDLKYSGEVRRIAARAIGDHLDLGEIVVISPLGFSPSGEVFNLTLENVATETAIALNADKLIFLAEDDGIRDSQGKLLRELRASDLEALIESAPVASPYLACALRAAESGVERVHVLNRRVDGALLLELFTHGGIGSMATRDPIEKLRQAAIEDVNSILRLLKPLEVEGALVQRTRELLESDLERFSVLEHDGTIIGCVAFHPFFEDGDAELACLAVHEDYRRQRCGERLLNHVENEARSLKMKRLFVLTTRTAHWFLERGFIETRVEALPEQKRALYNHERRSKVLVKNL
ncbi:MAG: amino-acid N-acetyltransferase [Burkholderiales bacterium]